MAATKKSDSVWSDEEKAAMQERAREQKAEARRGKAANSAAAALADLQAKIAEMPDSDRTIAEKIHALVMAAAPDLQPKTWYGMPAWATREGKLICFFKSADKFKSRYATFGFEEAARIDEGTMWPTSWGLTKLTDADAKILSALVKKAVG
jgi:hypothetical protein